jgi:hypothetical protein
MTQMDRSPNAVTAAVPTGGVSLYGMAVDCKMEYGMEYGWKQKRIFFANEEQ